MVRSGLRLLILLGLTALAVSCKQVPFNAGPAKPSGNIPNINTPTPPAPPPKPSQLPIGPESPGQAIWKDRCNECHDYKRGIGKYHGEDWIPIVDRMMKKDGAHLTPPMARSVFFYLADYTRLPGDKTDYVKKDGTPEDVAARDADRKAAADAAKKKQQDKSGKKGK